MESLFRVKRMILKLWSSSELLGNRRCSSVRNIYTLFDDLVESVRKIIGQFPETIYHNAVLGEQIPRDVSRDKRLWKDSSVLAKIQQILPAPLGQD